MLPRAVQSPRLRPVLTLRADFYHRCVDSPDLAALIRAGSLPLAAPDMPALLEMITDPAVIAIRQVRIAVYPLRPNRGVKDNHWAASLSSWTTGAVGSL